MARSKRKKSTNRIFLYILLALIFLIFLGIASFFLYFDFFKVTKVEAPHSIFYERSQFLQEVEKNIASQNAFLSLFGPENIIFWEFSKKDNLAKDPNFPYLTDLNIKTNFWERTIKLETDEKKLMGVFCSQEKCYAFDKDGVAYARAPSIEGSLIFKVEDENERRYVLGRSFLPQKEWVDRMLESSKAVREEGYDIKNVVVGSIDLQEWKVILNSGTEIRFSFRFVPTDLNKVLANLSEAVDFSSVSYVDLRVPGRVYYK